MTSRATNEFTELKDICPMLCSEFTFTEFVLFYFQSVYNNTVFSGDQLLASMFYKV